MNVIIVKHKICILFYRATCTTDTHIGENFAGGMEINCLANELIVCYEGT